MKVIFILKEKYYLIRLKYKRELSRGFFTNIENFDR